MKTLSTHLRLTLLAITITTIAETAPAQSSFTWNGSSTGNWSDNANWTQGSDGPSGSSSRPQVYLNFDGNTKLNNTNDYSAGSGFQIYFKSTGGAFNLYGNSLAFYDFGAVDPNIQNEGTTVQTINFPIVDGNTHGANGILNINVNASPAQGPLVFNGTITAADANIATRAINVSGTSPVTFNGVISDFNSSGKMALTQLGASTITLAGANSYSGQTTLNSGGTLNINNATALGTGTLTLSGNATIDNTSAGAITLANNNPLTLSGGSLTFTGTKDLNFGTGAVTLTAGRTLTINGGTLTLGGTISGAGFGFTKAGSGTLVLNGSLATTTGGLTVSAGTLTLAGANSYSGTTTLSAGTVNVNSTTAFGTSSSVAINGVTLDNTSGSAKTLANATPFTLGGNNVFTGTKDLNLGTGAMSLNGSTRTWTVNGGNLTIGGIISGSAGNGLTKAGTGTLTLSGANTYSGGTTVNAGTLGLSGTINSGTTGGVTVGNTASTSAKLNIVSGATLTVNNLSLGANATGPGAVYQTGGTVSLQQAASTANLPIGAVVSGYGYYNLSGGTLSLNEAGIGGAFNAATGVMDISGGTFTDTGYLTIARGASTCSGILNVTGGTINYCTTAGTGPLSLNYGGISGATAILNIGGGATAAAVTGAGGTTASGSFTGKGLNLIANNIAGTIGVANLLNNGTLTVSDVAAGGGANPTAVLNFNGGTLKATASNLGANFMTSGNIDGVYIYPNGGTIDNNGTSITISRPLLAPTSTGVSSISGPTTQGSGYIGAPMVTITGGTATAPATAYAVMADDGTGNGTYKVSSIVVTSPGVYTVAPTTVALAGGGGTSVSGFTINTAANTSGGVTFQGSGTTTLSGANTYTGTTAINAGTVSIGADNNLGASGSAVSLNGGTLSITTGHTGTHPITVGASGGTINVNAGTGQYYLHTANTLVGSGALTLTGSGTLTANSGNLRVDQANTYSGNMTIQNGGIFEYGVASAVGSGATFAINNQGELAVQSGVSLPNAITIGGGTSSVLSFENNTAGIFSGNITLNANVTVGLRDWYNNATVRGGTISGVISGAGALTVNSGTGSGGALFLSDANTYNGGTTVNSAIIRNNLGGNTGATGAVTPFGSGSVTVNSGAAVWLGNNPGSHNNTGFSYANAFTLNGGALYEEDGIQHLTGTLSIGSSGATLGSTYNNSGADINKGLFLDGVVSGSGAVTLKQSGINTGNGYNTSIAYFSNPNNTYSGTITVTPMSGTAGGSYLGVNASTALSNATVNLSGNNTSTSQQFGTSPLVFNTGLGTAILGALSGSANIVLTGYNESTHVYGADSIALNVGNNNSSTAYSGVMSGAGSLTKTGSGTFTMSGVNTYTGDTTVNGGTLTIGTAGQLASGSYAGNISVGSGATFIYNSSAAQTLSGTVSGAGTLQESGSGALTISGTLNSSATVSGGKLAVTATQPGTSSVTVNAGGDLAVTASGSSQWAPATLAFGSGSSTLEFNGVSSTTVSPLNPASVANSGSVTVTINSGTFNVGSTYPLVANAGSTNGYTLNATTLLALGVTAHLTMSGSTLAMQVDSVSDIWTGAGANWDTTTSGNWTGHAAIYADGDNVLFDDTATANTNVTVAAQVNPGNVAVNNNANKYSLTSSAGNYIGGSGGLTKSGTNALTLAGPNTYSGGTTLAAGQLNINDGGTSSANSAIGTGPLNIAGGTIDNTSSGDVTLLPNNSQNWNGDFTYAGSAHNLNLGTGSVTPSTNRQVTVTANTLTVGGAIGGAISLTKAGNGTLVLGGSNTYSGGTTLSNGTLTAASTAALGASGANVTFAGTSGTTTLNLQTDGGDNAWNINLGSASVGNTLASDVKNGSVGTNHTLGTLLIGNTTLNVTKGGNVASGSPAITFASLNLSAGVAGTAVLNPGSASLSIGSASIAINNSAKTLQLDGTNTGNTVTGVIADGLNTVSVSKANSGTWTLSGANTYSGATTISGGILNVSGTIGPVGSSAITTVGSASANAVLNVSGTMNQKNLFVGNANGAVGAVYHPAGTVTATNGGGDNLCVGNISGGYGYYNLSGGNILANGLAVGGENNTGTGFTGTGGNGIMDITGGFLNDIGWVVAARGSATETGVINVFGGALSYAGGGIVNCWGSGQVGIVNILGGIVTNSTDVGFNLNQSANTGNTAVLNLNAGLAQGNSVGGTAGQLNFNGGTLRASKANGSFLTGIGSARVYGSGGTIDNNSFNITIAQPLIAPAGNGITGIASFTGGSGYIAPPIVTVLRGSGDTTGTNATAIAQIDSSTGNATSGQVTNIIITCAGVNYTATPTFTLSGGGATIAATVTGQTPVANTSGGMTFNGTGVTTLSGANTYTGTTLVGSGTVALTGSGSLTSTAITVHSNAAFDVSALASYTLNSSGTLTLRIDKTGSTLKQGRVVSTTGKTITYGGSLTVTATGDALASGDSFTLFTNAGTYTGWFTSVTVPALASGLAWDTNHVATAGILDAYSFSTTALSISTPTNTSATVSATKLANHASSSKATPVATLASTPAHGTASISSGALTYTPAANYAGSDSFTVTFQDGHGFQTMSVSVTVGTSGNGQSPNILSQGIQGGNYVATFAGYPGETYTVETNNVVGPGWTKFDNYTAPSDGVFSVTNAVGSGNLFFRTVWPSY